ncbi:hypothetical protein FM125_04660 [Micrococcus lylae]|uniref:Molecular chaperone DnaJ n=2 Tax=Micrococcus lylae TaxID=1273 RepID=A0A1R4IUA9_9MICC|nr:DnaJ domain-containing protein [Micrococcus lylae]TFI00344.1 molecular chaperone DnaJ [Micrococcus lylae]SJN23461.1 hypothetical protein FM125_04660 [Micrococcus lylae]
MSAAELGPQTAYEVLAVRPDVDAEQLRRAYRRAARRAHPDAGGSPEAFRRVSAAWELVGTAEARRRYDLSLSAADTPTGRARTGRGTAGGRGGGTTTARASDTSARPGPPPPSQRPVRYLPPLQTEPVPNGVLDAARSARRWHGVPRRRGLLPDEHRQRRQARVLRLLDADVAPVLPAARFLTGLSLGGRFQRGLDVDHAVLCGDRLALIGSMQVPDGTYTWDGAQLSAHRSAASPPLMGPAMTTLQRSLPQVTVGGFVLVMTDRDERLAPVIRRARGADDPAAQQDLLTAAPAAGRDLVRELLLFLGTGSAPDTVDRAALGLLVDQLY